MRIFASFLAAIVLLAGCATSPRVEETQQLKEKELEMELTPYESIGFYMSVGDPLKALKSFETAYSKNPADSVLPSPHLYLHHKICK